MIWLLQIDSNGGKMVPWGNSVKIPSIKKRKMWEAQLCIVVMQFRNFIERGGGFLAKGSRHAAWNRMQKTFTNVSWFSSDLFPTHHTGNQLEVRETPMLEVWSVLRIGLCAGGGSDMHWKKWFKGCLSWRQKTIFYKNH